MLASGSHLLSVGSSTPPCKSEWEIIHHIAVMFVPVAADDSAKRCNCSTEDLSNHILAGSSVPLVEYELVESLASGVVPGTVCDTHKGSPQGFLSVLAEHHHLMYQ